MRLLRFFCFLIGMNRLARRDGRFCGHSENGQTETWYSGWFFYLNVQHLPELFRNPTASDINSFNSWIRAAVATIIGGNKSIIRELFE